MNITAYQEKEKNKKTRTTKKRAEERMKKQVTNFEEAVCCPSAVVWGAA